MKIIPAFGKSMTRDELYEAGYNDGLAGVELDDDKAVMDDYFSGWQDGVGDSLVNENVEARPVDDDYYTLNPPPTQFDWAGEKRTPTTGDFYLSKAGNPNYAWRERKNSQERHILWLKGHEGHDLHPEHDNKKSTHIWCRTCNQWIKLEIHKV